MASHKSALSIENSTEQLSLNIPGFDFTPTEAEILVPSGKAMASDRSVAVGQLRLKLDT